MDESDKDSWSFVDEDEARDRVHRASSSELSARDMQGVSAGAAGSDDSQTQSLAGSGASSGGRGNDSPPRPAVLEAVDDISPRQQWDLSMSMETHERQAPQANSSHSSSLHASQPKDYEEPSSPAGTPASSSPSHSAERATACQLQDDALDLPSFSSTDSLASSVTSGSMFTSEALPPVHTNIEDGEYNYDDGDSMSESSSGTAVMVTHPCSDEEDTAERRWRLAEKRGNDIRRARAPPCPKGVGTDCFLKVIVVGESGLGKSTFIQNLQSAFQPDAPSPRSSPNPEEPANTYELFEQFPEQLCTQVVINTGGSKFHYLLQDTPGLIYGQTNVRIPDHITAQNAAYLAWEQNPQRSVPMSASDDPRVDACLFFLNPNHLKDAEVAAMAHLSELVSVVPMIAKADIFTPAELAAFRLHVQKRVTAEEDSLGRPIMWRPAEAHQDEDVDDDDEQCCQPPFAVIASSHTDLAVGRFWPVRTYPWGKCEALSSTNSDLSSLKRLLFEEGFVGLKQATEERYYRFRAARLTQSGARQPLPAAEEANEEETEEEVSVDSSESDTDELAETEYVAEGPTEAGACGPTERRGHRTLWVWGLVLTGLVCGALMGNVSQLKADKRSLQRELTAARDLADMKDQVMSGLAASLSIVNEHHNSQMQAVQAQMRSLHRAPPVKAVSEMEAYKPLNEEHHLKPHTVVQMKDSFGDGSGCTMLISAWRDTLGASLKHTRKQPRLAPAQNATDEEPIASQEAIRDDDQIISANGNTQPLTLNAGAVPAQLLRHNATAPLVSYKPASFSTASHTALQSVAQAAKAAGRISTAAGAHSIVAVQYTAHRSVLNMLAAAKAAVRFSQVAVNKTCDCGQSTTVAVYNGVNKASASLMHQLITAQHAVGKAGHATAIVLKSFSSDVAEATGVLVRDAPLVARRMQQDWCHAVHGAQHMIRHGGQAVGHGLSHAAQQVSKSAHHSIHYMRIPHLKFSMPRTGWDAKTWLRFMARLGVLGAAL